MRVSGQARLKTSQGDEYELDLAGWAFAYRSTWEPSLDVFDIYEAEVSLGGVTLRIELLESSGRIGDPLSLRVPPQQRGIAELVWVVGLARLADGAAFPAEPVVAVAPMTREAHLAAYGQACDAIAREARMSLAEGAAGAAGAELAEQPETHHAEAERSELRARCVQRAAERMAAIPRPFRASPFDAVRKLYFDTGYYQTEVLPAPVGLSAAGLIAAMLALSDNHRGVDAYGSDGVRRSYRARPAELAKVGAETLAKIDICTQFSTRGPGGTRPGIVYDRDAGGFVFDGPTEARDAFRDAILSALQTERDPA